MDELYDEYCVTLPRQQDVVERRAPVVEKWSTLLQGTNTPSLTAVASFLLSIPITNASTNFEYSCKEFYTYALKEKALLEAARSSKEYKVKKSI
ncbi:Pathogenesis-related thaumatin-like protein 3.4 [Dissostichus eleginoides]|uniref:Pathogenesis-related thaumatin-like protein 3.4 n=1 Tax=Dissostichus eleginoides TaxID=100907 RepID=A0AAD9CH75_DISEL|nr:Pathogenesis-related thaumatin-like protein 3.4 [Dissostichus eleginoides]